jgi:predicted HicB family RNase H-like nuclease
MSRFANLADKQSVSKVEGNQVSDAIDSLNATVPPSRVGRKVISGYFSPEMSLALHLCARRAGVSLQALIAEAFNDVLRKYGESPVGE